MPQAGLVPETTKVAGGCDAGTAAVQDRYSREDVFSTALLGENGLKDAHQIQLEVPVPWHRSGSWSDEQAASTVRSEEKNQADGGEESSGSKQKPLARFEQQDLEEEAEQ